MDEPLMTLSREGLRELLEALNADNLTCYFYNPFSRLYWLFHKEGNFRFRCQMHGPLTLPGQRIRMECDIDRENTNTGVTVFTNSGSSPLASRILAEEAFASREDISSTIRIRVLPHRLREKRPAGIIEGQPFVVIFVNYRKTPCSQREHDPRRCSCTTDLAGELSAQACGTTENRTTRGMAAPLDEPRFRPKTCIGDCEPIGRGKSATNI